MVAFTLTTMISALFLTIMNGGSFDISNINQSTDDKQQLLNSIRCQYLAIGHEFVKLFRP
jgi:hypothetical protein